MRHAALLLLTSVFLFGEFAFGSQAVAAETVCENTEKEILLTIPFKLPVTE